MSMSENLFHVCEELEGRTGRKNGYLHRGGKKHWKATSVRLAKAGVKLVLAGIRESSMKEVREEVANITGDFMVVQIDVSKWEDVERTAEKTLEEFGRIDILVENAESFPAGKKGKSPPLMEIDEADWNHVLDVDLKGHLCCVRAVTLP